MVPWMPCCYGWIFYDLHLKSYIFANILQTPTSILNLTIFGKPMKCRFQWNLVHMEILSTFHVRVKYISVQKICNSAHSNQWGCKCRKIPKQPLPFGAHEPHLMHECLGRHHSLRQTTARLLHALPHNYATKAPLITMGRRKFTPETAHSPSTIITPSNTPITRLTPQTIPNGIQIQSAILTQYTFRTDRHTDWQMG